MLRVFKAEAIKAAPPAPLPAPEEPNLETGRAENDFVDWDTVALPTPGDYPAETLPQRPETPVPAVPPAGVSTTQMLPRVTEVKEKAQASVSPKAPQPKDEAIIKDTQPGRARIRDTPLKWWPAAEAGKRFAEKAKGAEANGKRKDETSGKRNSGHRKRGGLFELLEVESPAASESSSDEERPRPRPPTEQETASVPVAPEEEAESSGNGAQKEWDELFLGGARAQEERLGDVPEEKREEALVERAKGLVGRLPAKGLDAR